MTLGELIKDYREKNCLSQRQFAIKCGVSNGYIAMLERGYNPQTKEPIKPTLTNLMKISKMIGMSLHEVLEKIDDINVDISNYCDIYLEKPPSVRMIPILGNIACGTPIFAEENITGKMFIPNNLDADYCLYCKGDSMIGARVNDGDLVYIKQQPTVDNGQIAAVLIDGEATLKRVYYYPQKHKLVLSPENPKYEPLVYVGSELDDVKIIGLAVAFISNIN